MNPALARLNPFPARAWRSTSPSSCLPGRLIAPLARCTAVHVQHTSAPYRTDRGTGGLSAHPGRLGESREHERGGPYCAAPDDRARASTRPRHAAPPTIRSPACAAPTGAMSDGAERLRRPAARPDRGSAADPARAGPAGDGAVRTPARPARAPRGGAAPPPDPRQRARRRHRHDGPPRPHQGWNTGAEQILGWSEAEVRGKPADVFLTPSDRTAGIPEREMAAAREHGRSNDERWRPRQDGRKFWASGEMMPLTDEARARGLPRNPAGPHRRPSARGAARPARTRLRGLAVHD